MELTIAQKVLARHAGRNDVAPGEYLWCDIDAAAGIPFELLDRVGAIRLHDPDRTYVVEDHLAPPPTIARANVMVRRREEVRRWGVRNFFDYGRHGILHQVFAEHGMFAPGELIAMPDSHATSGGVFNACVTSASTDSFLAHALGEYWFRVPSSIKIVLNGEWSNRRRWVMGKDVALYLLGEHGADKAIYKSIEVVGSAVAEMTLSDRWTIANMGVELGAKFCIFEFDDKVAEYLYGRVKRPYQPVFADAKARYDDVISVDTANLVPMIACPHDPSNVRTAVEVEGDDIKINQAFIGSCTNGRLEDYAIAAEILAGRRVHPDVRLLCSPASQSVWKEVLDAGYWSIFAEAGANIEHSTCGPCFGGHLGVLGDGEVSISSTNRNFRGRQGSPLAEVYLANPAVVAASAVAGRIIDPDSL